MEWNLRASTTSPWDLTEFEQEQIQNIDGSRTVDYEGHRNYMSEFSVDLKLGQVGNSSSSQLVGVSKMVNFGSVSGSSKRARAAGSGIHQSVSCLVDGCVADLSNCRDYHRRHKVCELHSKSPQVSIVGNKQRFCQQCSRFHALEEFDEGKRSCRKRLDGHNRRRRKPQPDPLARSTAFSNYPGTRLLPYNAYLTTGSGSSSSIQQQLNLADSSNQFIESSSCGSYNRGGKEFAFLQGSASSGPSILRPHTRTTSFPERVGGSQMLSCDWLVTQSRNSDCALSLLSSPQPTQTTGTTGLNMLHQNNSIVHHQMNQSFNHHSLGSMGADHLALVPNSRDAANVDTNVARFQMGTDGLSRNKAPQTLPFYWE